MVCTLTTAKSDVGINKRERERNSFHKLLCIYCNILWLVGCMITIFVVRFSAHLLAQPTEWIQAMRKNGIIAQNWTEQSKANALHFVYFSVYLCCPFCHIRLRNLPFFFWYYFSYFCSLLAWFSSMKMNVLHASTCCSPNSLTTWTNATNSQFSSFIWVCCRWLTFGLLRIQYTPLLLFCCFFSPFYVLGWRLWYVCDVV